MPAVGPGPTQFFNGIGFAAPQGWTVAQQAGGIGIKGPDRPNAGPCLAIILAPIPAEADLALEAETLVTRGIAPLFGGGKYQGDLGQEIKTDSTTRSDGVSGMGWPFVELYGKLGSRSFTFVHVLLAKMGNQVVPLVGISQSGDWQCMGDRDAANWLLLVHGLVLPGYTSPTDSLKKLLVGSWQSVSSHVAISETYAANGHFGRYAAHSSYWQTSSGEVIQETSGWPGDGTYEVHGDRLTKKNTNDAAGTTYFFSIVRRPDRNHPTGFGWALRLVQKSPERNSPFVNTLGRVGD